MLTVGDHYAFAATMAVERGELSLLIGEIRKATEAYVQRALAAQRLVDALPSSAQKGR